MKIASIDIGTNAIKSKIFETSPASIKYIDGIRSSIRLGKEVFEDGKLSDKKLKQLTKTLQKYQKKFKKDKIDHYEIVATSAFRNTSNSEEARICSRGLCKRRKERSESSNRKWRTSYNLHTR